MKPVIGITTDIDRQYYKIKHHYAEAVILSGGVPVLLPYGNPDDYVKMIDGLLIPGGKDLDPAYYNEEELPQTRKASAQRSAFEMKMVAAAVESGIPVLGICYGMQLLNVFFDGSLYQDLELSAKVEINHKKGYHYIVTAENRFLMKGRFSVNSTHHQAVEKPGKGLSIIARSDDGVIEAFCKEDYPFLVGVQWHPERQMNKSVSGKLFISFIEAAKVEKRFGLE